MGSTARPRGADKPSWIMLAPLVLVLATLPVRGQAVTAPLAAEAGFGLAQERAPKSESCFTMQPPGPGWRLLELAELREVYPEAEIGLAGPHEVRAVLCVREEGSADLALCVDGLLGEQGLEQVRQTFREATRIDGRLAAHALVTGRRDGTWWRYLATAFREGKDLYLLLAWGPSDETPADGSTLLEAALGLERVEGVGIDELSRAGSARDADGPGWRVRGGVYRDAALGFALVPRGAWRVATRAELAPLGPHVHAGLMDELHGAVLGFVADRVPGVDHVDYIEDARRRAVGQGHPAGARTNFVAGREVELRRFALPSPTGFADGVVRGVFGAFFEDERCFQVLGRYPSAAEQAMGRSLPQGLASLQLLDESAARALAAEFASDPSPVESVGPGWCLRDGVFTDFHSGLTWTLPPGFWEVESGPGGSGEDRLLLYERSLGVRGWMRVDSGARYAGEAGHALALSELVGEGRRAPPSSSAVLRLGELDGRVSRCDLRVGRQNLRTLLASAGDERVSVRLGLQAPLETMERHADSLAAAVRALAVFRAPMAPTVMELGSYRDARLGFELHAPDEAWHFVERPIERFGPRAEKAEGVLVSFEGPAGQSVHAAAAWTPAGPEGVDAALETWIPTALRRELGLPEDPPHSDRAAEIDGVPCRRVSWTIGERTIEMALVTRSRTAFAVAATGVDPSGWLDGFRLVR